MLRRLADGLYWFTRHSRLICVGLGTLPLWLIYPVTRYHIGHYGCTVRDWQIADCLLADDNLIQALNNGLVFSLWGLLITLPAATAIYVTGLWGRHMLEIYAPRRRRHRPPLFKDGL